MFVFFFSLTERRVTTDDWRIVFRQLEFANGGVSFVAHVEHEAAIVLLVLRDANRNAVQLARRVLLRWRLLVADPQTIRVVSAWLDRPRHDTSFEHATQHETQDFNRDKTLEEKGRRKFFCAV